MNVKYCDLCRSTMIPLREADQALEQCSGPGFVDCSLLDGKENFPPGQDRCPHLCVGDVHFCSLDPAQKLIPCNQTTVSRCMDDGHRYCQLFLAMTRTDSEMPTSPHDPSEAAPPIRESAGVSMPESLAYAPNHMWYDHGDGRTCHIGVDAFFSRAVGEIDEIVFPHHGGNRRPAVRFTIGGIDLELVFPNVIQGAEPNAHVVADPAEVLRDPYGRGWLFEGITLPGSRPGTSVSPKDGLLTGQAAQLWMIDECDRMAEFVHKNLPGRKVNGDQLMLDGGAPCGPVTRMLDRSSLVRLHSEFFTIISGKVKT